VIVAIATEGSLVAKHFGRCPEYTLYKVGGRSVVEEKKITNPGHEPGFLPGYLSGLGVNSIVAGGMGQRARSLFEEEGIETYVGVTGPVKDVIETYLAGELRSGVSTCEHPGGDHGCG